MKTLPLSVQRLSAARLLVLTLWLSPLLITGPAPGQDACAPSDVNADLIVDVQDLIEVIEGWGPGGAADVNGDGAVDVSDLIEVIGCWNAAITPSVPKVGVNVDDVADYKGIVFNDLMKQSREWWSANASLTGPFNTGYADLAIGEDDWPAVEIPFDPDGDGPAEPQTLFTILVVDVYWGSGGPYAAPGDPSTPIDTTDAVRYPVGDYTILFDGQGVVRMDGGGSTPQLYTGPGPHTFTVVDPSNQVLILRILESSGADPVRNVRVLLPGYVDDENQNPHGPFYTPYVELLSHFNVARFMPMQRTNNYACSNGLNPRDPACVQSWDDRPLTSARTQATPKGVALEYMIQLANEADVDPWFVVPHAADDDYAQQMAAMIAANLEPERTLYIEYSNEVWNPLYDAYHYASALGNELGVPFAASQGWYARRSLELFCIFRDAGFDEDRLVTVISGQANNPFIGQITFEYMQDDNVAPNPCGVQVDTYGIGHYFNANDEFAYEPGDTVDDVIDKINLTIDQGRYFIRAVENQKIASSFGVRLIAYEGGQGLVDSNQVVHQIFAAVNRDPRIKEVYLHAMDKWQEVTDGDLYMYLSLCTRMDFSGFWGHVEYIDQQPYVVDADGLRPYKLEAILEMTGQGP